LGHPHGILKIRGESLQHCRTENVRHVEHDRVLPPALDKGIQLVLDVLGLLPGKPRHRIESAIALAGETVAGLAIVDLGLELPLRSSRLVLRVNHWGEGNQDRRIQRRSQADDLHDRPLLDETEV
jgi:hypothetical protein